MTTSPTDPTTASPRRHLTVPVVAVLHAVGITGIAVVATLQGRGTAVLLTLGLTAYGLGLRHAFDPDHIATIDNTTRRLVRTGRDARGVGLWFSLGHSTVVLVAAALLTLGVRALVPMLDDDASLLHRVTGVWGPLVASTFLLVIGGINLVLLRRALRAPAAGAGEGAGGGPVTWLLRRFEWATDRPRRMYGVGLLFGLGFDTATSIGLLAVAAAVTLDQNSWYAAVPLAILFAAGMSLLDSAQGAVARRVYASAGSQPPGRRRVRYDVVVTGVSAAAALGIAVVTLVQTLAEHVPAAATVPGTAVDLDPYGVVLTVVLVAAWGIGALVLRQQRREA
ncbi:HoxN/HupN/NixA family nickel/cobalt transporter [Isoptericola croceus]|uniref:HoxN/HupN/NixA family nickel/cobalt transporter n=1 Tax=Isoptericola croceus TaxID=3031406 RepID=UPI0023F6E95A|nr:HoxN/HupN/NixA family nickel/cobalt transporter [Isoptericola croceus]